MKIVLKNLLTALRRYPTSVLLNIAGLSVAFTAFLVIMMQVRHEYGFDRWIPQSDCVFRVEQGYDGKYQTLLCNPLINELKTVSAHIRAAALVRGGDDWLIDFRVERNNGMQDAFRTPLMIAEQDMIPILGLELIESDGQAFVSENQVLLPQSLARKMFPDESAVGRKLVSEGYDLSVSGVYRDIPDNSVFYNGLIQPWEGYDSSRSNNYQFFIRLDDAASAADVAAAMNRTTREFYGLGEGAPETAITVRLTPAPDIYFERDVSYEMFAPKGNRTTTDTLLTIAILVIVIASINFVNFASALTPVRMKMINLQKVLGAGVWQLRSSLLFEAAVISLAAYGVALCLVVCLAGTPFAQYVSADMSLAANLSLAGWCALIALCVGFAAGLYPAFYMTSFRPILAVQGSFGTSLTGRRYRLVLVGLQYVISLALIIAALFVNLQNRYLTHLEMGFDKEQVIVIHLSDDAWERHETLTGRLKSLAGVVDVAYANDKFLTAETGYMGWTKDYRDVKYGITFKVMIVSDNFLRVMGIPVAAGRDFLPSDTQREPCAYVFNRAAEQRYAMQPGDYVDQTSTGPSGEHYVGWGEAVGFLPGDVRIFSEHMEQVPFAFAVMGTLSWHMPLRYCYIRVHAGAGMTETAGRIRRAIADISPFDHDIEFMDTVVDSLYRNELKAGALISLFSLLSILVSLMGVFGLVLFETQYRRKEIGIRKVNGATSGSILRMFNRRFALIVLASFLIAVPVSWYGVGEWLRNFRSAVPLYPWVFLAALAIVLSVTVLTVTVRSWRTANENPVKSVKTE